MQAIRYLLKFFIKIAFSFLVAAFIWWLVSLIYPSLTLRNLLKSNNATSTPLLPSPRTYQSLFGNKKTVQNEYTNVYVPAPPFNGYNLSNSEYTYSTYSYVTYTSTGTAYTGGAASDDYTKLGYRGGVVTVGDSTKNNNTQALPSQSPTALLNNRTLNVRNLSIYEGGHVYTGLSFIGEAKASMFKEGKFPIIIVDQNGKMIGVSAAVATTNWAVPGWVRFQTKIIYTLPNNVPCTMVFEEALDEKERITRQPLRVPLQVRCN